MRRAVVRLKTVKRLAGLEKVAKLWKVIVLNITKSKIIRKVKMTRSRMMGKVQMIRLKMMGKLQMMGKMQMIRTKKVRIPKMMRPRRVRKQKMTIMTRAAVVVGVVVSWTFTSKDADKVRCQDCGRL